jgi:hypothetical protein
LPSCLTSDWAATNVSALSWVIGKTSWAIACWLNHCQTV